MKNIILNEKTNDWFEIETKNYSVLLKNQDRLIFIVAERVEENILDVCFYLRDILIATIPRNQIDNIVESL